MQEYLCETHRSNSEIKALLNRFFFNGKHVCTMKFWNKELRRRFEFFIYYIYSLYFDKTNKQVLLFWSMVKEVKLVFLYILMAFSNLVILNVS